MKKLEIQKDTLLMDRKLNYTDGVLTSTTVHTYDKYGLPTTVKRYKDGHMVSGEEYKYKVSGNNY